MQPTYQYLSRLLAQGRKEEIEEFCRDNAPSGSGIDAGTTFNFDESKVEKLVFNTSFHHMNENGFYDGLTEHKVIVTPSFCMYPAVRITGRDRNFIKDYLADVFDSFINEPV